MHVIASIPKKEWTKSDKQFWKQSTDPEMYKLLQDVRID